MNHLSKVTSHDLQVIFPLGCTKDVHVRVIYRSLAVVSNTQNGAVSTDQFDFIQWTGNLFKYKHRLYTLNTEDGLVQATTLIIPGEYKICAIQSRFSQTKSKLHLNLKFQKDRYT